MSRALVWIWLGTALLFAVFPGLDLWVSGLFFDRQTGHFPTETWPALQILREVIWNAFHLVALVPLLFGIQALYTKAPLHIPGRFWGYCITLVLLGPVVIVNLILKSHWGRARPAEVEAFGGSAVFTPPLQWARECANNCSFVSGEASAAVVCAMLLGLMLWNVVPAKRRLGLVVLLVAFVLVASGLRVIKGRHFLSDVLWAAIFMSTLAYGLAQVFNLRPALVRVTLPALKSDAGIFVTDVKAFSIVWRRRRVQELHRLRLSLSRHLSPPDMASSGMASQAVPDPICDRAPDPRKKERA